MSGAEHQALYGVADRRNADCVFPWTVCPKVSLSDDLPASCDRCGGRGYTFCSAEDCRRFRQQVTAFLLVAFVAIIGMW